MANVNNPHGLRPLMRTIAGGNPSVQKFKKAAATAYALFINDAVGLDTSNRLIASTDMTPGTNPYLGVNLNFGPLSTLTDQYVIVSPDAIFEAQDNNTTDGFAEVDMGLNANLILSAPTIPGPTTAGFTGVSGHMINETGAATTNTLDVHLLRLLNVPDNAYGANSRIEILFNRHRYAYTMPGV